MRLERTACHTLRLLISTLRQILELLTRRERAQLLILAAVMLFVGLLDVAAVFSVPAFLAAIITSNPAESHFLSEIWLLLANNDAEQFVVYAGIGCVVLCVCAAIANTLGLFFGLNFTWGVSHSLSWRLLRRVADQEYPYFLSRNSSDTQALIQTEVPQVIQNVIAPILLIIQKSIVVLLMVSALLIAEPIVTVAVGSAFIVVYFVLYKWCRHKQSTYGDESIRSNKQRFRIAKEMFEAMKTVKIYALEDFFVREFERESKVMNYAQRNSQFYSQSPRFLLEGFGLAIIITLAVMSARDSANQEIIPMLGLVGFAAYKILPALQLVYQSTSRLRFGWPRLKEIHQAFEETRGATCVKTQDDGGRVESRRASTGPGIEFERVGFHFNGAPAPVFVDLDLSILPNSTVGIFGTTGSGKSTLLDLAAGLLLPTSGSILVDGEPLDRGTVRKWQRRIGYVTQDTALIDASIARNIAFGEIEGEIDLDRVREAAQLACIDDFIANHLSNGYHTHVGERGIRLSGGQRQRLGLARALFRNPGLLILDEATSALDEATEEKILNAILSQEESRTIIMVAHRLRSLRHCDRVMCVEQGRVVASGAFEEVVSKQMDGFHDATWRP